MSQALKGRKLSEEHKRKIGLAFKGRKYGPYSDERKKNIMIGTHKNKI